ncbi:response regulator transcription factor [Neptunitalea lumnitzerae]|uniref:DNA-binding response regulator n=1 Tax=Neptunitalea lumnitzerae TaxID=2965509 RepID=A0ABQ5MMD6_9FLAO|nr:response regulator transcription factor [Neptunitalea sp. Y10]GLB50564.1 DNA-binding response regulator [Neptunitalea sp. Y10]
MIKVLLVEDDLDLGNLLKQYLELNKFYVVRAFNGVEARRALKENNFDIAVLDVMMPDEDGFELAEKLKITHTTLPFIFVTARKMKDDIIKGLQLGADDYITKPFDADELILRIQNILKRTTVTTSPQSTSYSIGLYTFDVANLLLTAPGFEKVLTEKEAQLLEFLYVNRAHIIKKEAILNHLWEEVDFFSARSLDVFISRLRKYLSQDVSIKIESIRGVGYRFLFS